MTYTEFGTLMETKGKDGTIELCRIQSERFSVYCKLGKKGDDWVAYTKEDEWTELYNLEYREKQTPGREFDEIINKWNERGKLDSLGPLLAQWRVKHKDFLDKVKE